MNIFYLSPVPKKAAEYHVDKHVVKMILESAQLLCTAHRLLDGIQQDIVKTTKLGKAKKATQYVLLNCLNNKILYNTTHINHPCSIWVRNSINNYMWLYELFVALCDEYTLRYGKKHKTDTLMRDILKSPPKNIPTTPFTQPALAMPDEYKNQDPVLSYRQYYIGAKSKFAKWTKRQPPSWFIIGNTQNANI